MKTPKIKGIVIPMVTPFKSNKRQDIDEEGIRHLVNVLLDSEVHALMPCGGTGESVSLSPEENKRVIEVTVEEVNGRVPVIGGAKSPGTRNSVNLAKDAKEVGADVVLVQGPYYLKPITTEGYYQHFKTVVDEAEIPVLVYNLEGVQGEDIPISVIERLTELDGILGLKNSTINLEHVSDAIKVCNKNKKTYFQGKGHLFYPSLALGAHGSITSILNAVPSIFVDLYKSWMRGEKERAMELHFKLMPLLNLGTSPVVCKAALNLLGHPVGDPRKPLMPITSNKKQTLKDVLKELGLI
jgi:4-hydroxy-tetrahydrodipicolinate synthase